jgi:arylsulfatase A-like enzyme
MRSVGLYFVFAAIGIAWFAPAAQAQSETRPPNIVFILLDNLGQEWLGCYGSEEGVTPNIDRLAREGLRVEHCYTPPVCGPSRIVALTGRYLFRSGMVMHHDAALYSGGGLIPDREPTFARPLRDAGYRTMITGKWQINNLYDEPEVLSQHGFDESLVWPGSIDTDKVSEEQLAQFKQLVQQADTETTSKFISNIENRYWDPVFLRDTKREVHPDRFGPDVSQQYAFEFLRSDHDRPFLLYYPMVLTHGDTFLHPVVPTPLNRDPDRPHQEMFADMVRYADQLIGEFIEELERTGLRDNTIVFIATDNGTEKQRVARARGRTIRGELYQLTEAGSDVALLVNAPGRVPGGRTIPLADFSDLLPTFCDLTGAELPENQEIDGRSFADAILGQADKGPREWIFNQYGEDRVVRNHRYKLYNDGRLFDVEADFDEEHDLAKSQDPAHQQAKAELQGVLDSLPPDAPPPFPLRSQTAFQRIQQLRAAETTGGIEK